MPARKKFFENLALLEKVLPTGLPTETRTVQERGGCPAEQSPATSPLFRKLPAFARFCPLEARAKPEHSEISEALKRSYGEVCEALKRVVIPRFSRP